MATSGTHAFQPNVLEMIEEAYERAGVALERLTARKMQSAVRSLDYALKSWSNRGVNLWKIDLDVAIALTQNDRDYSLPVGAVDVMDIVFRDSSGVDTPMRRISRDEYTNLHNKTTAGTRPDRYFVDRSGGPYTIYLWPVPDATAATGSLRANILMNLEDAGNFTDDPDVESRFFDALAADLAHRLAMKWNPPRAAALKANFDETWQLAKQEDRERADVVMSVRYS